MLDRQLFGDAHRVVVFLGKKSGKLSAVAYNARRSKKRFGASLDLFCKIDVQFVDKGHGGMPELKETTLIDSHPGIRADLISIAHAGYLSELTSSLLKDGQGANGVFKLLSVALGMLDSSPMNNSQLRYYELALLDSVGLAPVMDQCVSCGRNSSKKWLFDLDEGGIICDTCPHGQYSIPVSDSSLRFLRSMKHQNLKEVQEGAKGDVNECRYLLSTLIDQHVGRKLKAREFLRNLAHGK